MPEKENLGIQTGAAKHPGRRFIMPLLALAALWFSLAAAGIAADTARPAATDPFDYADPKLITATLYETGSDEKKILFTFRRTATRSGTTVHAERQFLLPDGSVAAVENAVYESGQLVSFEMKEFQANVSGSIKTIPDPKKPAQQKMVIAFGHGLQPPKGSTQTLPPDTVIDDTLYPFMLAHWDELMHGNAVKFHFVSLEWERTFMFRFIKTGETMQNGRTVEQIKMQPTNLFVAHLVNPLYFNVEKDLPRRILSYIGRTTPRIKKGKSWKYLDAETVFDWK